MRRARRGARSPTCRCRRTSSTDVGARIIAGRDLLADRHVQRAARRGDQRNAGASVLAQRATRSAKDVQIGPGDPNERWITIVGIMADMRGHGVTEPIRPTAFGSTLQYSWPRRHIGVRTAGVLPASLAVDLRVRDPRGRSGHRGRDHHHR